MTAIRIIDDHTELANIGSNTHAQIDTHITAASDYVKRDGSLALTADWDIGNGLKIIADHIRARDADGLKLYDDGGNGIFVKDGGDVGIGTAAPARNLHVHNSGSPITTIQVTNSLSGITSTDGMVFGLSSSNDAQFWIFEDIDFYIGTAGTERLRIKNGGNVGIGTGSPSKKLDVFIEDNTYGAGFKVRNHDGFIDLTNGTGAANKFAPVITMDSKGVNSCYLIGDAQTGEDTGTKPIVRISARINNGAVSTRPLFDIANVNTSVLSVAADGDVGIATELPTAKLDVNSDIVRVRTAKTPAHAGAAGNQGDICWDADYVYVCVATNTWKRSALGTW